MLRLPVKSLVLVLTFSCLLLAIVNSHDVGDAHDDDDDHGHGHSHGGHGHSHDAHGHSHGGHGHSHGGHGHSHDGHGHSHDSHGHSHNSHGHSHDGDSPKSNVDWDKAEPIRLSGWQLWFQALSSTLLISLVPYAILFLIRVENTDSHKPLLHVLLSFASGGLLGDAFLHLIPHAIDPHEPTADGDSHAHSHGDAGGHGHSHSRHMQVGLWVVAGIMAFLLAEKAMRTVGHGHSHGSHQQQQPGADSDESKRAAQHKKDDGDSAAVSKKQQPKKQAHTASSSGEPRPAEHQPEVKLAGYLNLLADCMHNFTDGLAIGASFALGRSVGLVTTATILFHEVPHEIGDYAILLQSGVPVWKARALQLLTAAGAIAGTVVALACGGANPAYTAWILPFTAGGFVYIALVTVVPELLQPSSLGQTIKELLAFVLGVGLMVLVGIYE